ncbi:hypothetical protein EVAR_33294_1 [Eumeta japonica]|uniref:Reverse transcriptase domain-containing protein n=1 Tax=Eumeta variegata TaxID=151549 RepID=A0A4C1WEV0_EUMVA|nr:hypothetical protein EVAR_33294_1 [Eumeta japonica]
MGEFYDLCKAFDRANHEILIEKLRHYVATGLVIDLLELYLSNRFDNGDINGIKSSGSVIRMGVSQGSVLDTLATRTLRKPLAYGPRARRPAAPNMMNNFHRAGGRPRYQTLSASGRVCFAVAKHARKVEGMELWYPRGIKGEDRESTRHRGNGQMGSHTKRLSPAAFAIKKIGNLFNIQTTRLVCSCFHSLMPYGICFKDMLRMFTEFLFCKSGPFAQFMGWNLVFLLEFSIMLRGTTGRPRRRPRTRGRLEHWNLSQTVEGEIQLNKDNFELRKKRYAQS